MPRYVALLRGINVGGHRVKMDDLRRHFAALKFTQIETFIASGNVIFESASGDAGALETRIERHLARILGYEAPTFIRTFAELNVVTAYQPFAPNDAANEAYSRYVLFLRAPLDKVVRSNLEALSCATDEFRGRGREIYWLCRGKISDPTSAAKAFEKLLRGAGANGTLRNLNMLQRLVVQETPVTVGAPVKKARRVTRADTSRAGRPRTA